MTDACVARLRGGDVDEVLHQIDILRRTKASAQKLLELLPEQAAVYAGRSSGEADRIRGYVLASFEPIGLPRQALPYLREELETGSNPYTVAAAARAARGGGYAVPAWLTPLLMQAINRIKFADEIVSFDRNATTDRPATAVAEIARTIAWLGPRAQDARAPLSTMLQEESCCLSSHVRAEIEKTIAAIADSTAAPDFCCSCEGPPPSAAPPAAPSRSVLRDLELVEVQDQDGVKLMCSEFLDGSAAAVTFFYTRCMNPNKCSLTITKLGRLQQLVGQAQLQHSVKIAGFTYDPAFDLPRRMRAYGNDRGMTFDARNRLMRTTRVFEDLRRCFDLSVGYGTSTVNGHRLELIVLDAAGRVSSNFVRTVWD
jgi:protein SCO1/2